MLLRNLSLSTTMQVPSLLGQYIDKRVCHELWEADQLSTRHVAYAATDALAHLLLSEHIKKEVSSSNGAAPASLSECPSIPLSPQQAADSSAGHYDLEDDNSDHEEWILGVNEAVTRHRRPARPGLGGLAEAATIDLEEGCLDDADTNHEQLEAEDDSMSQAGAVDGISGEQGTGESTSTQSAVLRQCKEAIKRYFSSSRKDPLHMPSGNTLQ